MDRGREWKSVGGGRRNGRWKGGRKKIRVKQNVWDPYEENYKTLNKETKEYVNKWKS